MGHWHGKRASAISALVISRKMLSVGRAFAASLLLCCGLSAFDAARAQGAAPQAAPVVILTDGNAVVTGFSGAQVTGQAATSATPADRLFIDLEGYSARVVDLQDPGAPPQAQLLSAPKPFTLTAGQIGQVFGVALDNANPPNIYLAATSVYGLPIVVPAADGTVQRSGLGGAGASFMPGLFGPPALQGGPGSIWRVDGATGQVSLFANVALGGVPNSGPALGGLAFDPASGTLFVADRATGMIHGFDRQGRERTRFDHGVQGRQAAGLNAVAFDPARRLDITNPAFNSEDPSTWSLAPPERRVFALAVHAGRLYYSVADGLQVWSVAIAADGSLASDPRVEVQAVPGNAGSEISKIAFDDQGRMLLAERAPPTGAYDFGVLAQQSAGLALRLQAAQPSAASALPVSAPNPDEYAIGFFDQLRNSTGGIAIGYGYTAAGLLDRRTCGGFLWTTGDELRNSADPTVAAELSSTGPLNVDGLQGNVISLVRPANVSPQQTYFVDYSDSFGTDANRGHIGDIAIWRRCAPGFAAAPPPIPGFSPPPEAFPPPGFIEPELPPPPPPGGFCPPDQVSTRGWCCPPDTIPQQDGSCEPRRCPPGTRPQPNGFCCPLDQITRFGFCCPPGTQPQENGYCRRIGCPPDWTPLPGGRCCPPGQASGTGVCCPPGTRPQPNGRCEPTRCPPGTTLQPNGTCCPNGQLTRTGVCCPPGQTPQPNGRCAPGIPSQCPPGQILNADHVCVCPNGARPVNGSCLPPLPTRCPPGQTENADHVCVCPSGRPAVNGQCLTLVPPQIPTCPRGEVRGPDGSCVRRPPPPSCPRGEIRQPDGACAPPPHLTRAPPHLTRVPPPVIRRPPPPRVTRVPIVRRPPPPPPRVPILRSPPPPRLPPPPRKPTPGNNNRIY